MRRNISPLRYPGGKTRAINIIREQIRDLLIVPSNTQSAQVWSPFFGGGSLELALSREPWCASVCANDLFAPLVNFWTVTGTDCATLQERCRALRPLSRDAFNAIRARLDANVVAPNVDAAADYFAINRASFSGATYCGGYSREAAQKRFTASSIARLGAVDVSNITFACEDACAFIVRMVHDAVSRESVARDIMYLDPPYYCVSYMYGRNGDLHRNFDHVALRDTLIAIARDSHFDRWIMSYGDCPYIRELYGDVNHFAIKSVNWSYGMTRRESSEILIYPRAIAPAENGESATLDEGE